MFTWQFVKDLGERVLVAAVSALLAGVGGDLANVWVMDWGHVVGLAAGAALVTLLEGIAATRTGDPQSASVLKPPPSE